MRSCLIDEKIQEQLQLTLTLLKINTKKGLLQLVKTSAPPLRPMPVKRTMAVTILVTVTNLRPMADYTMSEKDTK